MAKRRKKRTRSRRQSLVTQLSSFAKKLPRLVLYGVSGLSAIATVKQSWDEGGGDWGQFAGRMKLHFTGFGTDGRFYWQAPASTYAGIAGPLVVNKGARAIGVW